MGEHWPSCFTDVRCTRCGSVRIARRDGSPGACSLVPKNETPGCPSPLYDVERETGSKGSQPEGQER